MEEIGTVVALLGVLEGRGHVVGSEGLLLDAGGPRIGLICGGISRLCPCKRRPETRGLLYKKIRL